MTSKLKRFEIVNLNEDMHTKYEIIPVLLNPDHIVSIKPIVMNLGSSVIQGYWVRLSNGKKYRTISIPAEYTKEFGDFKKSTLNLPEGDQDFEMGLQ